MVRSAPSLSRASRDNTVPSSLRKLIRPPSEKLISLLFGIVAVMLTLRSDPGWIRRRSLAIQHVAPPSKQPLKGLLSVRGVSCVT